MPATTRSRLALLGGTIAATLGLAVGAAVGAVPKLVDSGQAATAASGVVTGVAPAVTTPAADLGDASPTTAEAPTTTVAPPTTAVPVTSTTRPATKAAPPTTVARASASPAASSGGQASQPAQPAAPKVAPGQRVNPSSAAVQAAINELHTRIPMFSPTASQLLSFADAACNLLDQGQTMAQVQAAVRQAVTYVQGASLSDADTAFAVRVVVQLRCPGYLS